MMARPSLKKVLAALGETARVASVMVDGDVANRIIADRAHHYIANPDPKFKYATGDYYDVDHAAFLSVKKTLLRLEKLVDFPCNASLWVRVKGLENHVTVAVQNGSLHRYWQWAEHKRELTGEMAGCFACGEVTVAPEDENLATVLAPVRDSLGDVVAVVELTAPNPKSAKLAPAWS